MWVSAFGDMYLCVFECVCVLPEKLPLDCYEDKNVDESERKITAN